MKTHRLHTAAFVLLCSFPALGQNAPARPAEYSFTISASQPWTDTGVDLAAGDTLVLTAEAKPGSDSTCNPWGMARTAADDKSPVPTAPVGEVIAKTAEDSEAAIVGTGTDIRATEAGHLYLGLNGSFQPKCSFVVKVKLTHGGTAPAVAATTAAPQTGMKNKLSSAAKVWLTGQIGNSTSSNTSPTSNGISENGNAPTATSPSSSAGLKIPTVILDSDLRQHLDGLPRRVHDHLGNLGDMVNFVIIGSQEKTQAALEAADWHIADVDSKEAGLKAIMNTYEKKDYLQMPMSHLFLFDRMQDFGYEQAQAFAVVASRHHFRLWKAPFTWNNETVWVGAGTHDVGFEKDVRTGKLTHKIDPAVDGERENIAQSLDKSGKTKSMTYYLPPEPVQDAKNASGGGYHSDGRLLVVFLK